MKTASLRKIKRVLIVAGPGVGDTFLASPIASSLLSYNPDLKIDFLVRAGGGELLRQCNEVSEVIEFDKKTKIKNDISTARKIFRKYDLAIATNSTDRTILAAVLAAPIRYGVVPSWSLSSCWKRWVLKAYVIEDNNTPIVSQHLQIVDLIGIPNKEQCLLPSPIEFSGIDIKKDYAVINITASGDWKNWSLSSWETVVHHLQLKGLVVYLVGGDSDREKTAAYDLAMNKEESVVSLLGKTSFSQLRFLLTKAKVFIGVDSFVAHLAAQCTIPTIAIFGPTNPLRWGPRAINGSHKKIEHRGSDVTVNGNVFICKASCFCKNVKSRCFYHEKIEPYCLRHYSPETICALINEIV